MTIHNGPWSVTVIIIDLLPPMADWTVTSRSYPAAVAPLIYLLRPFGFIDALIVEVSIFFESCCAKSAISHTSASFLLESKMYIFCAVETVQTGALADTLFAPPPDYKLNPKK